MVKHLIYLAAGSSRRFGGNKLLYPLEGRPLFSYGLETLRRAVELRPECELTVVSRYPQILEAARAAGGRAVDSPQSARGISHTIRAALDALPPVSGEDFLFFAVADQPWLEEDTLLRLVDAARPGVPGGTAAFGERVGSPTFFSGALLPELYALTGDQGGRPILRELGPACVKVQAGSLRELEDLDIPPERGKTFWGTE
ncbi:MAG: nucleotidyltransferase family protein [Oscillospiraceae bacterium]|nr:nucleotidyltransferase family protein [Oscillospiraceae bacterium]